MDEKFNRRFVSFTKSLDALAEARERDLSDSFVRAGPVLNSVLHLTWRGRL